MPCSRDCFSLNSELQMESSPRRCFDLGARALFEFDTGVVDCDGGGVVDDSCCLATALVSLCCGTSVESTSLVSRAGGVSACFVHKLSGCSPCDGVAAGEADCAERCAISLDVAACRASLSTSSHLSSFESFAPPLSIKDFPVLTSTVFVDGFARDSPLVGRLRTSLARRAAAAAAASCRVFSCSCSARSIAIWRRVRRVSVMASSGGRSNESSKMSSSSLLRPR